jgi:hypothetical protein
MTAQQGQTEAHFRPASASFSNALSFPNYEGIKYKLFLDFLQLRIEANQSEENWEALYLMEDVLNSLIDFLRIELPEQTIDSIPSTAEAMKLLDTAEFREDYDEKFQREIGEPLIGPDAERKEKMYRYHLQNSAINLRFKALMQGLGRKLHPQSPRIVFPCDKCSQVFYSEELLNAHTVKEH